MYEDQRNKKVQCSFTFYQLNFPKNDLFLFLFIYQN